MKKLADYPSLADTTPEEALDNLPSVYQAIGKIAHRARRTKNGSKLNKTLWDAYDKLNGQGAALSFIIRTALKKHAQPPEIL